MGLDTHGKGYISHPNWIYCHAPLSEVRSNALICMKAHVADVCITVTSTANHNNEADL